MKVNAPPFPNHLCKLTHYAKLWELLVKTHNKSTTIPYSLVVLGESGVGKSALARAYSDAYPKTNATDRVIMPVLYFALTDTSSPNSLLEQTLRALTITQFNRRCTLLSLQDRLLKLLKEHNVELIIIDEVQECLPRAHGPARQKIIKLLTWLIDHSKIPFVMFGTPIAQNLLRFGEQSDEYKTEEQFSRRCYPPVNLTAILPRSHSWLNAVNFFLDKLQHPHFNIEFESHKDLLNRLYIATSGKFGLLEKFMLHLPVDINMFDEQRLTTLARVYFDTISTKKSNPFNISSISDVEIEGLIEQYSKKLQ